MNRLDLVTAVASGAEMSPAAAGRAVDAVFGAITGELKSGGEVRLIGFGTFTVADFAAREGRNPLTGEKIQIASSKQAKFKPGKRLRDELNPKPAAKPEPAISQSQERRLAHSGAGR